MKKALNLACGSRTIESTKEMHWINVDSYERSGVTLDRIMDITKKFSFLSDQYDYIYSEQFIEHINWLEGLKFLRNCFRVLKKDGILRLVLPDYRKIFQKYLDRDYDFFDVFFKGLNEGDLPYYTRVYNEPQKVKKERKDNPPPRWHTSGRFEDRKRLELRCRRYTHPIEIVDWFVHQYFEHKCLYDFESLIGHLSDIGFSEIWETDIKDIDSHEPTRITSSLYIEAIK